MRIARLRLGATLVLGAACASEPGAAGTGGDGGAGGAGGVGGAATVCSPGSVSACYDGPDETAGVGACKKGRRTCAPDGSAWGECVGQILPVIEDCEPALVDEDCDGEINESGAACACEPGDSEPCYEGPAGTDGVGVCKAGARSCRPDRTGFGDCEGQVLPKTERCDDLFDNDCDGEVNEDGAWCNCIPGALKSCYSGPPETRGIGACRDGQQICNEKGTGYGKCSGGVLPAPETCETLDDDDCDGIANEGGPSCVCTPGTAIDCDTGETGACGLGKRICLPQGTAVGACGDAPAPTPEDCKSDLDEDCDGSFPPCGAPALWVLPFGGPYVDTARALATDADEIIIGGGTTGPVDFGGGPMGGGTQSHAFVLRLDASGAFQSAALFGDGAAPAEIKSLAVTSNDEIIVGGSFFFSLDFGVTALASPGTSGFVAGLSADGTPLWAQSLGSPTFGVHVAPRPDGGAAVHAAYQGTVDVGCEPQAPSPGKKSLLVAAFAAGGGCLWAKSYGDAPSLEAGGAAVDATGALLVTGSFPGSIDFGGGALPSGSAYVAKFAATGDHLWSKSFGAGAVVNPRAVAVTLDTGLAIGGTFTGTINFGGVDLTSTSVDDGDRDAFVARFDGDGNHVWSRSFGGGPLKRSIEHVVFDADGNLIVGGYFQGAIEAGDRLTSRKDFHEPFVVKLDASGDIVWSKRFGDDDGGAGVEALAVSSAGDLIVAGGFLGAIDAGTGAVTTTKTQDAFVAVFPP